MVTAPEPGSRDVVEQGAVRRWRRPGRRVSLVVGALLLGVVVVGTVVDRASRAAEAVPVAGCVRAATSAVRFANARVDAISFYVAPAVGSEAPARLRRRQVDQVSRAAEPTVPVVRRARVRCAEVEVHWFHSGLRQSRRDCLALLDRDLRYLEQVTTDGSRAFSARSLPTGRCTTPAAG